MKILVMIDMQNDFLTGALGNAQTAAVLENVCRYVKKYLSESKAPFIYTMDTHSENYLETQEGKNLPITHCIENTDGWKLPNELEDIISAAKNNVICKKKDTFGAKELPNVIAKIESESNEKIDEIELIGVCTDICVISNALLIKAFYPEIQITVNSMCCAGVTPQSHLNALEAMKMCQIRVS